VRGLRRRVFNSTCKGRRGGQPDRETP
jgi:hypothetical protein